MGGRADQHLRVNVITALGLIGTAVVWLSQPAWTFTLLCLLMGLAVASWNLDARAGSGKRCTLDAVAIFALSGLVVGQLAGA